MKKISILVLICGMLLLSSCVFKTGDELFKAPKPSKDYVALQNKIDEELSSGKIFAAAEAGINRNTVQLYDIDADGEEEAIAFFRESQVSGVFNIVIYKKNNDSEYVELGRISGLGSGIEMVEYPKLSAIGAGGIAISWKISNQLEKGLTIAKFDDGTIKTVLDTKYMSYITYDIDFDGVDEIFVINRENDRVYMQMYTMLGTEFEQVSKIELSKEIDTVSKIITGELISGGRAIAIDSRVKNDVGLITDIVTLKEGRLINLTLNKEESSGMETYRISNSYVSKLTDDNILYVPTLMPMRLQNYEDIGAMWITNWHIYDAYNKTQSDLYTFHNNSEGWYYKLSKEQAQQVSVEKNTITNTNSTKFRYHITEEDFIEWFEILTIPIDDYVESFYSSEYIVLEKTSLYVYIAKNLTNNTSIGVLNNDILENFQIINSRN